jgi:pSer/pThr/pTyr-binding forkhead associated (FHA) protein
VTEEQTGPAPPRPAPPPPVAAAADGPVPEGTVALEPGPPPPSRPKTTGSADTRALTQGLLTRKKPDGGKTFVIDSDGLVLGRSTSCDVLIQGATVSRRHAVITWEEDGYWIEDVSSGGGISVNGERHQRVRLASGDQVEIGAALFEYEGP